MRRKNPRASLLGARIHAIEVDYPTWQSSLLPAPRSAVHSQIRELLYEHGFTINGARNRLDQEKNGPAGDAPLPILIDREVLKEQLLNLREALKA